MRIRARSSAWQSTALLRQVSMVRIHPGSHFLRFKKCDAATTKEVIVGVRPARRETTSFSRAVLAHRRGGIRAHVSIHEANGRVIETHQIRPIWCVILNNVRVPIV